MDEHQGVDVDGPERLAQGAEGLGWLLLEGEELCGAYVAAAETGGQADYVKFFSLLRDALATQNSFQAGQLPEQDRRIYPPWRDTPPPI